MIEGEVEKIGKNYYQKIYEECIEDGGCESCSFCDHNYIEGLRCGFPDLNNPPTEKGCAVKGYHYIELNNSSRPGGLFLI